MNGLDQQGYQSLPVQSGGLGDQGDGVQVYDYARAHQPVMHGGIDQAYPPIEQIVRSNE